MSDIRLPYDNELMYFMQNRNTPAMAAEDNRVTFNPHSGLSPQQLNAVLQNELSRLTMRKAMPPFKTDVTSQQQRSFMGTPYENDPVNMLQTILARVLSRDPSAGVYTPQQGNQASYLSNQLMRNR